MISVPFDTSIPLIYGPLGIVIFLLRLVIAQIFLLHGYKKITQKEPRNQKYAYLGYVEFIFGFLMLVGYYHQIAALVFMIIMAGALYNRVFVWRSEYMNVMEFDVLIFVSSFALFFLGPGMFAWGI